MVVVGGGYCAGFLPPNVAPTSLHVRGGLSNPFISREKKQAIHSLQIPFCHGNPPLATPSHTPVARRGCLKQHNKKKKTNLHPARADGSCFAFSGLQPLLQSGTNPVTGEGRDKSDAVTSPRPLLPPVASHWCPQTGSSRRWRVLSPW